MISPTVTIITPYTADRLPMMQRLAEMVKCQDYPVRWQACDHKGTIGAKLNWCIEQTDADIIIRMDSDDCYAPDWVSRSVAALGVGNCTGLSKAYFKSPDQWYLYNHGENKQPYVCGATMCFYRSAWENNRFPDTSHGEDLIFQTKCIVRPHDYIDGFTAMLHGGNTASHLNLDRGEFTKISSFSTSI